MKKVLFFFGVVNEKDIDWLATVGAKNKLGEGDVLVTQGEPIELLAIILSGECAIDVDGERISAVGSGEIIGELSFLDSRPPSASVIATEETFVLAISRTKLKNKLDTDMAFASRFYQGIGVALAHRLREATSKMGYGKDSSGQFEDPNEIDPDFLDAVSLAGVRFDGLLQRLLKN